MKKSRIAFSDKDQFYRGLVARIFSEGVFFIWKSGNGIGLIGLVHDANACNIQIPIATN